MTDLKEMVAMSTVHQLLNTKATDGPRTTEDVILDVSLLKKVLSVCGDPVRILKNGIEYEIPADAAENSDLLQLVIKAKQAKKRVITLPVKGDIDNIGLGKGVQIADLRVHTVETITEGKDGKVTMEKKLSGYTFRLVPFQPVLS